MPTYDYICTECANEFEEFQRMSDPVLEKCPKCNGKVQRKVGGGAGLLFKGSGFYITDYKKGSEQSKPPEKDKSAEKPTKGSSSNKQKD